MAKAVVFFAEGTEECEALLVVDLLRRAKVDVTVASASGSREILSSHKIRITADALLRTTWAAFANAATTFTLPRKFFIEAEYYAMSRFRQANLDMKSYHSVTLSFKKRLLDNRLTLTAQVANLFDRSQRFVAETETFVRDLRVSNDWQPRRFVLTVNYSFKTGKSFKARKVESGAGDEKGRM